MSEHTSPVCNCTRTSQHFLATQSVPARAGDAVFWPLLLHVFGGPLFHSRDTGLCLCKYTDSELHTPPVSNASHTIFLLFSRSPEFFLRSSLAEVLPFVFIWEAGIREYPFLDWQFFFSVLELYYSLTPGFWLGGECGLEVTLYSLCFSWPCLLSALAF